MQSRHLLRSAVAAATFGAGLLVAAPASAAVTYGAGLLVAAPASAAVTFDAGLLVAAPASAAVTYDPVAHTGFVGAADVRRAFGWSAATLAAKAAKIAFAHEFRTVDTYAVACGKQSFRVAHDREYGRFELIGAVAYQGRRSGYRRAPAGFRLSGASAGISGTSTPPTVGQPCPQDSPHRIGRVTLRSSTSGWTLVATAGDTRRTLLTGHPRR